MHLNQHSFRSGATSLGMGRQRGVKGARGRCLGTKTCTHGTSRSGVMTCSGALVLCLVLVYLWACGRASSCRRCWSSLRGLLTPTPYPDLLSPLPALLHRKQAVLEETSLEKRLRQVLELVREQTRVLSIASKIHSEVEGKLNSRHREYYLRQQLKAIRSELGEEVAVTVVPPHSQPYVRNETTTHFGLFVVVVVVVLVVSSCAEKYTPAVDAQRWLSIHVLFFPWSFFHVYLLSVHTK